MSKLLDDLPPNLKAIVKTCNITSPEEIITTPNIKLLLLSGCTEHDIRVLKEAAAKIVANVSVPVSQLLKSPTSLKWSRISFGCTALDRCMLGGVVTRGITEICGVSGAGKTQLLLQLSLTVQLPPHLGGLGKNVAFICTEDIFPSKRLFQMAKSLAQRQPQLEINFLGNIYIENVLEGEDLLKCVARRLANLMENINIGLIVIDSVAAVFRLYTNYIKRAQQMRKLSNCLLHYADKYNCAVICVNQVTTVSNRESEVPCLGLSWAHLGRTRIKISKVPKQVMVCQQLISVRKFEIMFSPESPNEVAEFLITEHGIVDVP